MFRHAHQFISVNMAVSSCQVVLFWLLVSAAILSVVGQVLSLPGGAPLDACSALVPGHNGRRGSNATNAVDPPGGFYIYTELLDDNNYGNYTAGTMYKVTLQSLNKDDGFRGFVIQAREYNTTDLIGVFILVDSDNTQILPCPNGSANATVTHTNNYYKQRVTFYWIAPISSDGRVDFRYSVVTTLFNDFYADLSAADYRPPCDFPPTLKGDYTLSFTTGVPEGCMGDECEYYVAFRQNEYDPRYLDVYLSGVANGWVAIGFSMNTRMESDDVLGCRLDGSTVNAVDTWNIPVNRGNTLDSTQDDICQHFGDAFEGRITCCFSRLIDITDVGMDYNLNDSYWLFFGRRLAAQNSGTNLASHRANEINPIISEQRYNPVMDNNVMPPDNNVTNSLVCPADPGADATYTFQIGNIESDNYTIRARVNPYNSYYLDFALEGVAGGWVAIGFSQNQMMDSDDVLGCRVDGDVVTIVDTWNPSPRGTPNVLDATQTDLCPHYGSFTDGRISCRFSRLIEATDAGQDYNLNGSFWQFYGRRLTTQGSGPALGSHRIDMINPIVSSRRYNLVVDNVETDQCIFSAGTGSDYVFTQGTSGEGDYYLATRVNPNNRNYMEVVLEGVADGWVAVGFSIDRLMRNDDVLGCRVDAGIVSVVDTYNPNTEQRTPNAIDDTQIDICTHSSSFTDGRISCSFSRLIQGLDGAQDFNLNSSYWLFYGRRLSAQTTGSALGPHTVDNINPVISNATVNPVFTPADDDDGDSALALSSSIVLLIVSVFVVLKVIY